ncbi:hypothetical protein CHLRE_06g290300v5 [Chlamydomonas reinhardtii]|uniref:Uncharacterized protein n=1 Tax=Chlamydomonas reinhardtii TaxID=3055 RepID=A0A2K3DQ80_CHLRE|nr:uncharacterized protein CHLRE_06g290300v5 [Chlamydomonas reinhardtii]PNW82702.1 hypothetical protein CHLRE_06g290300v5 [Chlamydomonas reinhardtii]
MPRPLRSPLGARSASDGASINLQNAAPSAPGGASKPVIPEAPGLTAAAGPSPQRAAAAAGPEQASSSSSSSSAAAALPGPDLEEKPPMSLGERVKRFFAGSKLDKQRLAALGFGAFSAYGVISNINAGILITIAWLTVVRTTGLTPMDAGNWPKFLAIYAGLWVGSNFLRPIRLTLALAAAPLFDGAITAVSKRTGLPKVPAFVVMLFFIAIGTTSLLVTTIAALGGFPPGCRMPWQPLA